MEIYGVYYKFYFTHVNLSASDGDGGVNNKSLCHFLDCQVIYELLETMVCLVFCMRI